MDYKAFIDAQCPLGHSKAEEASNTCRQHLGAPRTESGMKAYTKIMNTTSLKDMQVTLKEVAADINNRTSKPCEVTQWILILHSHITFNRLLLQDLAKVYVTIQQYLAYWSWAQSHIMRHRVLVAPIRFYYYARRKPSVVPKPAAAVNNLLVLERRIVNILGCVYHQFFSIIGAVGEIDRTGDDSSEMEDNSIVASAMKTSMFANYTITKVGGPGPTPRFSAEPSLNRVVDAIGHLKDVVEENLVQLENILAINTSSSEVNTPVSPGEEGVHGLSVGADEVLSLSLLVKRIQAINRSSTETLASIHNDLFPYLKPNNTYFWTKIALASSVAVYGAYRMMPQTSFANAIHSTCDTFKNILMVNFVEPVVAIARSLTKPGQRSGVHGAAIDADISSLARMVAQYAEETQPNLPTEAIAQIESTTRETGEIPLVFENYEQAIRNPIRSVVFGELIRLMLIQVQKQKVDMNRILVMTDGILAQHELNFNIMALMPFGMMIGLGFIAAYYRRRSREGPYERLIRIRLRDVELLVNQSGIHGVSELAKAYDEGLLLLHVQMMRVSALRLGDSSMSEQLLQDFGELEYFVWDRERRLRTIDRMYRTHSFLSLSRLR
eukprot:PhF_6_TR26402/c0_g1_i6/m.38149/K18158/NCA2; nuclear control of ATPase protein 2